MDDAMRADGSLRKENTTGVPTEMPGTQTIQIQKLLDRLQVGDESARGELIRCACARLERLTHKMLRSWERVHRWEDTSDVLQNALMRLYRSLGEAKPAKAVDFFRLAALNIRRELHDLAKHYYGPHGDGMHHFSVPLNVQSDGEIEPSMEGQLVDREENPVNLAMWAEFHDQVGKLPEEERELFDLLWYQELTQAEAAALLSISERTLKRRWASARLHIYDILGGALPDRESNAM